MSDEVNFVTSWGDSSTQCKNCKYFQEHNGKTACVPDEYSFEQALGEFGECPGNAHCDGFEKA